MPEMIRSAAPVCDIEHLVRAAHLHPEDQEEAGRRALGILRPHGLRWSNMLPTRRKSLAGAVDFNLVGWTRCISSPAALIPAWK